jgi:hypothetical protein
MRRSFLFSSEGRSLAGFIKAEQTFRTLVDLYRFGRRPNELFRIGTHHGLEEVAPSDRSPLGVEKSMGGPDGSSQRSALFDFKGAYLCSENLRNYGQQTSVLRTAGSDQDTLRSGAGPTCMQVHSHSLSLSHSSNVALNIFGCEAAETPDSGIQ